MTKDNLDTKILDIFDGRVVRKDLLHRIKKGTNVPTFVLEFFLARFCASDDEDEIAAGTDAVLETLKENYVRPDESNAAQSRVATRGKHRFIDKIRVNYVEKDKRHWASLENFNSSRIAISEKFFSKNTRMLEGGIWAEVTVGHNEIDDEYAFFVEDLRPIQLGRFDFDAFCEGRKQFSTDEWTSVILRSVGLEPAAIDERTKMHFLLRLAPLVEQNYNFIELGPRGTGKSYFYSEFSPYSTLVSGGQASKATLFYNNARKRVGLVGFWDNIAFDEVAGIRIRDPEAIQIMKDFMANGRFSRGTEIIADASLSFVGNVDESIDQLVASDKKDLFVSLPKELDLAVMDRFACYLPGWEMPKNSSSFLTGNYGLITDYLAEAFHHSFTASNRYEEVSGRIRLGSHIEGRDEKGIKKTVCAFLKMLHPGSTPTDAEFERYVAYAVEMRRRVKEQMNKRKPDDEFAKINLSYFDSNGNEIIVYCPESKSRVLAGNQVTDNSLADEPQSSPVSVDAKHTESNMGNTSVEVINGYEILETITAGGMAEVFIARKKGTDDKVFLKRVRTQSADKSALEREVRIYERLLRLNSQCIADVKDFIRGDQYVILVTELADGGNLSEYLDEKSSAGGLSVSEAKVIALDVAKAVKELHDHQVIHRDIKPENILKFGEQWKLADFGIAKNLSRVITQKTFQMRGTRGYAAPEQFEGAEAHPSADIYSLGKTLAYLISGQTDVDMVAFDGWRNLIVECVKRDASERASIDHVIQKLESLTG